MTTLPQDINLNGASLKVTLANTTKSIPLSNKEATPLDFSGVQVGSKLEFGLEDTEGFMFGYSELKVPTTAFEKNETEINEQLRFYLINKEKDSFVANIYAIFLNKGLFKEKVKERTTLNKPKASPNHASSPLKNYSKSPSGSPSKKSPNRAKTMEVKANDKNFQAYLNRLVDNHSVQLKNLVEEHNSINEFIQLNKLQNNLPQSFASDHLETYSPTRLGRSSTTRINPDASIAGGVEEIRVESTTVLKDLSPMHEKEKRSNGPQNAEESIARSQEVSVKRESASRSPIRRGNSERSPLKRESVERSPARSPLRSKVSFERKMSGSAYNSPSKRKQVTESFSNITDREAPDVAYYNAQISHLNNIIVNQNSRLSDMEIYRKENEELRAATQKSESARKVLQESILETTNELKQENRDLEKQIAAVILEKEGLLKKNSDLQSTVEDLSNALSATRLALQEKEDLNAQNALKLTELNDLKQQFKKIQLALINSENQKIKDQEAYKQALAAFEASLEDTTKAIEILNQEKKRLVENLNQVQQELANERTNHQSTQNELLLTKKKLENAENYKHVVASLEAQRNDLAQQLAESRTNHAEVQQNLQDAVEKLATRQREFETAEKTFVKERTALTEKLDVSEFKNDRVTKELNEEKLKVSQLLTNVSSLEQLICVKEDVNKQLEVTQIQLEQVAEDRTALRNQLEAVVITQDLANNKLLEVEKTSNQLRTILEEKEEDIEYLTVALKEAQDLYVPQKGDDIDNAVADYINNGSQISKLKLLFIREADGVYQFGSKRIYVKLEAGRVLIRVGGGFLGLDEFIDQYGPLEMEKLARTDPLKRLSQNIAVNKALIGKCVNRIEKSKTMAYEYRSDSSGNRALNSSPSLQRINSKGDY